ncbi:uncharacterized protein [Antedon mediterranea]|uniref:uncharacterized protein n=1 Tax=Antedon mediterranea TaxID=105859 RepID=UPI003AF5BA57
MTVTVAMSWIPIALVSLYILCIFGCNVQFNYKSSTYTVITTKPDTLLPWVNISKICKSSGGFLASLTSVNETEAVVEFVTEQCSGVGIYMIGLSRQSGLERNISENWIWETGEVFTGDISWSTNDPNIPNLIFSGVRIYIRKNKPPELRDFNAEKSNIPNNYICEFKKRLDANSAPNTCYETLRQCVRCRRPDNYKKLK